MLERFARFIIRRPRLVLGATAAFLALSGVVGGGVAERLTSGGFANPGSEAARTARVLEDRFGVSNPDLVLLVAVEREGVTVDDLEVSAAGRALNAELEAEPGVDQVVSYWTLQNAPPLRSGDGSQAMVLANITGTDNEVTTRAEALTERYTRTADGIAVSVGGPAAVYAEVGATIEKDLLRAESIAIPITILLLLFVFGSLMAASLPLAIGGLSVLGSFAVLRVLTSFTDVSIFALNLTTGMGLGLAIDYSLLIVSRFREELAEGHEVEDAVLRTVSTSGRTVIFSGVTVAVSLAALLVFPTTFLRSFAYAGIAVAILAVMGAIVVLPAMLAVLGRRVDRLMLWRRSALPSDEGFWRRVAHGVMRRPVISAVAVMVVLLFAGAPFLDVQFGFSDDRVLPREAPTRQVSDELREHFSAQELGALTVAAVGAGPVDQFDATVDRYAARLSELNYVARVDAATGSYVAGARVLPPVEAIHGRFIAGTARSGVGGAGTWFSVVPDVEPFSSEGETLVKRIRSADAPFSVSVGGPSAELVDAKKTVFGRLPLALLLVSAAIFVLLFLMFGSVVVPVKALILNVLSLSATFGAMVFIFQQGHFAGALDFTSTGTLDIDMPIMMFCLAFGLSMDYEVFLLSRIKEEYDRTGDNAHSVAVGLQRTGRIVTAAAVLLSIVFGSFVTSGVAIIKLLGLGLTLAILVDATLVRGVLVPAFMRLAGRANWWAPAPLRALHERFGISETAGSVPVSVARDMAPEGTGR